MKIKPFNLLILGAILFFILWPLYRLPQVKNAEKQLSSLITGKVILEKTYNHSDTNIFIKENSLHLTTFGNGLFYLKNLGPGLYSFTFSHPSYQSLSRQIPIKKGENLISIKLKRKALAKPNSLFTLELISLGMIFIFVYCGLVLILQKRQSLFGWVFLLFCSSLIVWNGVSFLQFYLANFRGLEFLSANLVSLKTLGYAFLIPAFFHTISFVVNREHFDLNLRAIKILYFISCIFCFFQISWAILQNDYYFKEIWGIAYPQVNASFMLFNLFGGIVGVWQISKVLNNQTNLIIRQKLKFFLWGITSGSIIFFTGTGLPIIFQIPEFFPGYFDLVNNLSAALFFGGITLAVFKQKAFDPANLSRKKFMGFFSRFINLTIYILAVLSLYGLSQWGNLPAPDYFWAVVALCLVLIDPLKDKFIFPNNLHRKSLEKILLQISSVLDLNKIREILESELKTHYKIEKAYLFIVNEENESLEMVSEEKTLDISLNRPFMRWVKEKPFAILKSEWVMDEEIDEDLRKDGLDIFQQFESEVCFPLSFADKLIGIIILGKIDRNLVSYLKDDLEFWEKIADKTATAVQNSLLHENILSTERLSILGETAASLAHEIKNPLTAIKGLTSTINQNYSDPEFRQTFSEIVPRQIERINDLVENLLTFAKPKPQSLKEINLISLLEETSKLFSKDLAKNKILLEEAFPQEKLMLKGDPHRLSQAFINLILNARQAMPAGGKIKISAGKNNGEIYVQIEDTGFGISPQNLKKIFNPFFTTKANGTGLGLAIVKKVIQEHNAKIKIESQSEQGTRITLLFTPMGDENLMHIQE